MKTNVSEENIRNQKRSERHERMKYELLKDFVERYKKREAHISPPSESPQSDFASPTTGVSQPPKT